MPIKKTTTGNQFTLYNLDANKVHLEFSLAYTAWMTKTESVYTINLVADRRYSKISLTIQSG